MSRISDIMETARVIPVIELADADKAVDMAAALKAGGVSVIELTLRTDSALDSLARIKAADPTLLVGMGTVFNVEDASAAAHAGADFLVTPGSPPSLLEHIARLGIAALPGIATGTELMVARDMGFKALKFFPAEAAGGTAMLKSFAGPFRDVMFCPTGGIRVSDVDRYLDLSNVKCVGGSWVTPRHELDEGNWDAITELARTAAGR